MMLPGTVALILALQAAPAASAQAREHVRRGYALAQRGELRGGESELRRAVSLAPNDPLALAALGMVLSQERRLEEANTYLERALKLEPSDTGTRYNLAVNQFQLGAIDAAKANASRVLELNPQHRQAAALLAGIRSSTRYDQALHAYREGKFAESRALLDQMIAGGNHETKTLILLAWCLQRLSLPEDALRVMGEAATLAPADATVYSNAAQILIENRDWTAANATVRRALELAPGNVQALKVKGLLDLEGSDVKQALETLRRAVDTDSSDPEALQYRGTAERAALLYSEAAATFKAGIARYPRYARMYLAYAQLLRDPGFRREAAGQPRPIYLLQKALALDPSLPEARYELGKLLLEEGRPGDALGHLEAAVKSDPSNSAMHLTLANTYRLLGRKSQQLREIEIYRELEREQTRETRPGPADSPSSPR